MPVYEYRCQQCDEVFSHRFATLRTAEGEDLPPCPACGAREVQRLISSVAVLSGGGGSGDGAEATTSGGERRVFSRKELNKALKEREY